MLVDQLPEDWIEPFLFLSQITLADALAAQPRAACDIASACLKGIHGWSRAPDGHVVIDFGGEVFDSENRRQRRMTQIVVTPEAIEFRGVGASGTVDTLPVGDLLAGACRWEKRSFGLFDKGIGRSQTLVAGKQRSFVVALEEPLGFKVSGDHPMRYLSLKRELAEALATCLCHVAVAHQERSAPSKDPCSDG